MERLCVVAFCDMLNSAKENRPQLAEELADAGFSLLYLADEPGTKASIENRIETQGYAPDGLGESTWVITRQPSLVSLDSQCWLASIVEFLASMNTPKILLLIENKINRTVLPVLSVPPECALFQATCLEQGVNLVRAL